MVKYTGKKGGGILVDAPGFFIKLFRYYTDICGPYAFLAALLGLLLAVTGLGLFFMPAPKRGIAIFLVASFLPLIIGIFGSLNFIMESEAAVYLEQKELGQPSAAKYYDPEYGYSKSLAYLFSVSSGMFVTAALLLESALLFIFKWRVRNA